MTASRLLLAAAALSALTACASAPKLGGGGGLVASDLGVVASETSTDGLDPIAKAAFWGTRYDRSPNDTGVAAQFSRALRATGNDAEALRVMGQAAQRAPQDATVQLEFGKALIANERAHEAVRPIQTAIANGAAEDFTAHSALGVAYDKTGRHAEARASYDRALAIRPGAAQVLNNKGLSYALQGKPQMAERTLRVAVAGAGGTARMRQNLALVLGLQGQSQEAEMLARADLPPQVADGNAAYYRSLVAQPAYWGGMTAQNADLPTFEDEPLTVTPGTPAPTAEPMPATQEPTPLPAFEPIEGEPAIGVGASLMGEAAPRVAASAAPAVLTDG